MRFARLGAGVTVLLLFAACRFCGCHPEPPELTWTSIDVNTPYTQADAGLLTCGRTNHILIDTGSRQSGAMLVNFLQANKIGSIQSVIITHAHRDHYGGMIPLLKSGIAVGSVYFNIPSAELVKVETPWGCSADELAEILEALRKKNIPLKNIDLGMEWFLDNGAVLRVVCAFNGINTPAGRTDINDTSAVMMLTHKKIKMLFAADLNRAIGDYLATNCPNSLYADILKFPHHGTESFPNDAFFTAVNARTIIVPASRELWLSERSARARQLTRDCKVYVNGRDGNITVISDGNSFRVSSDRNGTGGNGSNAARE